MERYLIRNESDVGLAVLAVRARAKAMGFSADQQSRLSTAVSELATNIVKYTQGKGGDIVIRDSNKEHKDYDILVQARDNGGGIRCISQALQENYSSGGTLGLGLPGVKRIVDYFQIASEVGVGTLVTIGMKL
jgi:serine/threonine-protein kinase RsbT